MNQFSLEGTKYYQQLRKCGKPTCSCAKDGPQHGPYWYSRANTGKVTYLGKNLPEPISRTHQAHQQLHFQMLTITQNLYKQYLAMTRLHTNAQLDYSDRVFIIALGFDAALVSLTTPQSTQEP